MPGERAKLQGSALKGESQSWKSTLKFPEEVSEAQEEAQAGLVFLVFGVEGPAERLASQCGAVAGEKGRDFVCVGFVRGEDFAEVLFFVLDDGEVDEEEDDDEERGEAGASGGDG